MPSRHRPPDSYQEAPAVGPPANDRPAPRFYQAPGCQYEFLLLRRGLSGLWPVHLVSPVGIVRFVR